MRHLLTSCFAIFLALIGCRSEGALVPLLDAENPTLLRRPFTAGELREELVPGFSLTTRSVSPDGEQFETTTVRESDADGVLFERQPLDAARRPVGEPTSSRHAWIELRNHASFPAARAIRADARRDTPLGPQSGWLYTVHGERPGVVVEYFFARALPGPPLHVRVLEDGTTVFELEQVARQRPD